MTARPILCLAITPAVQRTLFVRGFRAGGVNRAQRTLVTAAGKGVNVALALARLGAPVRLVGLRGGDSGHFIADALAKAGVEARWIETPEPTRHCMTIVEEDTGRVTELVEEAAVPNKTVWPRLEILMREMAAGCSWLALSGALPPGAAANAPARLLRVASAAGLRLCIDSQGAPLIGSLAARPDIVKLNAEELLRTYAKPRSSASAMRDCARRLRESGAGAVLVTDGAKPARLFADDAETVLAVPRVKALNPIGSGDCVTAGLLHGLSQGLSLVGASRFGLACGSANAATETPAQIDPASVARLHSRARGA